MSAMVQTRSRSKKKTQKRKKKYVYTFGNGKAEGNAKMKELLGGKGANLAEMTSLKIPVPAGFTITTEACALFYDNKKKWPSGLVEQVERNLTRLEATMKMKFGSRDNALLVSVRSGAAVSMPGMMDTVLNLGLNEDVVKGLIIKTENERFAWDAYRRFIQMFSNVVVGIEHHKFEHILEGKKSHRGVKNDIDLPAEDLKALVTEYKLLYKTETGEAIPKDAKSQLTKAINAVFDSWNNPRANKYRALNDIHGLLGTAVNVQAMVYGNMGDDSGTGVCFTRDPSTGKNYFYGEAGSPLATVSFFAAGSKVGWSNCSRLDGGMRQSAVF